MTPSNRSPARGPVGNGGDLRNPQDIGESGAPVAVEDPDFDPDDPWAGEGEGRATQPLGERLDLLRRKYMPLPDEVVYEFLGEDEYVVHSDHPSFRAFLTQNIAFVILIPIIGPIFVWLVLKEINLTTIVIFLLLDLIVAVLALKRLGDRYTSYVITNLRLIKVSGIVSRKLVSIPWTRMTGLGYHQTALGRFLGYATIFIESANEESGLREFSDVNDPATFHQRLLDMVSAKSGQRSRMPPAPTRGERRGFMAKHKERKRMAARQAEVADTPGGGGGGEGGEGGPTPPPGARRTGAPRTRPKVPGSAGTIGAGDAAAGRSGTVARGPAGPGEGPRDAPAGGDDVPDTGPQEASAAAAGQGLADQPAPEAPRKRSGLGGWLRWPGSSGTSRGAPIPPTPGEPDEGGADKGRRRPDQRAPSRPETIVIPRTQPAGQPRGRRKPPDPQWKTRYKEIDGY